MSVAGEVSNCSLRIAKRQTSVRMPVRQIVQAERRRMLLQKEGMRAVIKESCGGSQCDCAGLRSRGLWKSSAAPASFSKGGEGKRHAKVQTPSHVGCAAGRLRHADGAPLNP